MNAVAEVVSIERKIEPLYTSNIKPAEYIRSCHAATIPINTKPEDLLNPAYWAHVANELKPWGRVEARAIDGTWFAEYLVLDVGRAWAKMHLLAKYNLTSAEESLSEANTQTGLKVTWRGGDRKWSVVRETDSAVMVEGLGKDEAQAWLDKHIKDNR